MLTTSVKKSFDDQGNKFINQYLVHPQVIGRGSFAKVKVCEHNNKKLAIKIFSKMLLKKKKEYYSKEDGGMGYRDALQLVYKEIEVMNKLDHQNIVNLSEVIDDPEIDRLYLIIDYAQFGQLMDWDETKITFSPFDCR